MCGSNEGPHSGCAARAELKPFIFTCSLYHSWLGKLKAQRKCDGTVPGGKWEGREYQ